MLTTYLAVTGVAAIIEDRQSGLGLTRAIAIIALHAVDIGLAEVDRSESVYPFQSDSGDYFLSIVVSCLMGSFKVKMEPLPTTLLTRILP
jgi:hypothetical protein